MKIRFESEIGYKISRFLVRIIDILCKILYNLVMLKPETVVVNILLGGVSHDTIHAQQLPPDSWRRTVS